MSYRLLRQLARIPRRHRHFSDPFFYPTELYSRPFELNFPEYRFRDVFDELDEVMELLAEPEEVQAQRSRAKEQLSIDKSQDAKTQSKEIESQSKPVAEKNLQKNHDSLYRRSSEEPTFGRAQKIFEQASKEDKPALTMDENDELLKGSEEFKDILKYFEQQGLNFSGSTYQSSTIMKDGKVVTVSKHSKLGHDGTVKTEVVQEYKDSKGQKDSRKWVKEDKIKEQIENKAESKGQEKDQASTVNA